MATAPYIITENKTSPEILRGDKKIAQQIDTLQRLSQAERDKQLGTGWIRDMRDFYNLAYAPAAATPSYRPSVMLPELQFLMLNETSDLTNELPKVFITQKGERSEEREQVFQANWKQGLYNNRLFEAALWSQFVNVSWIQVGFSPLTRNGKGSVWLAAREPDSVYPDPAGDNHYDWQYVVLEDFMYIDEVRRIWPEKGKYVRPHVSLGENYDEFGSSFGTTFEMPPGPLTVMGELGTQPIHHRDTRVRVRSLYIFDNAREVVKEVAGTVEANNLVVVPDKKWRYPNGRFIVECEGITLADGPNYVPRLPDDDRGTFPIVGIWSLPPLHGIYGPPPVRYGRSTQELAERMTTQTYENAVRMNNAQTFIPMESGIDVDAYGGMPGEVQVITGGKESVPIMLWPKEMPAHMTQLPEALLQKVRQYQGFTPTRQGQVPQGNMGADIFDAAMFQSQALTRLRSRLYAESVTRIAQLVFYSMCRYKTQPDWFQVPDAMKAVQWSPISNPEEAQIYLDEGSLSVVSKGAMQKLAMTLAGKGLPIKFLLESFEVPRAAELAEEGQKELELAALAKLKRPR